MYNQISILVTRWIDQGHENSEKPRQIRAPKILLNFDFAAFVDEAFVGQMLGR